MSQTDGMLYFSTLTAIYKKPSSWNDLTELVAGDPQASGDVDGALSSARFAGLEVRYSWQERKFPALYLEPGHLSAMLLITEEIKIGEMNLILVL